MPYKSFRVPVAHAESFEADLNAFLRSHRVLNVDRQFVPSGAHSYWAFSIEYSDAGRSSAGTGSQTAIRDRIDYRAVLKPEEFAVYSRLRDFRKELATAEGVPVYKVFTNEQLAQVVQQRVTTKADLGQIAGIGDARIEKYGDELMRFLEWPS